ncbi:hypothetical protein HAZT_HAZT006382 [Hyalella azteca]|uniref:Uncharacterized protein n=1 Tax=Hyalella azteca TaxID=294128 RepID=A0A6A0H6J3_HYAAZ|nr:hypothetical protein HAZT_HAZT006382 [Hyalella azteca]
MKTKDFKVTLRHVLRRTRRLQIRLTNVPPVQVIASPVHLAQTAVAHRDTTDPRAPVTVSEKKKALKPGTGHLKLGTGHLKLGMGHLKLGVGHLKLGMGHLKLGMGHFKRGIGHLKLRMGHLKLGMGHFKLGIGLLKIRMSFLKIGIGDVKKKRRRHRSSSASHSSSSSRSSSSNSHSSSAGSSISERIKRKKKKKKAKKQQKPPKISLKALGFSDDPQLQSLDKELLKKITKKIYQSNALLSDVKDSKKKRKKKSKESDSSDSDKDKPRKKKKTKDLLLKSIEKYLVKKKPEDIDETEPDCSLKSVEKYLVKKKDITQTEPDSTASSKEILQLSSKEDLIAKYVKKKDAPAEPILEENTEPDRSTQEDELLELAKKYVMNVNKRRADASIAPQNDATKSKNPEASNVKIERMMQLSDLEDLQKKLQNYYSKYQDKANEGPKSKKDVDTPALELTPSKYLVSKPKRESDSKSLELNPSKYLTPKLKPEEETSNLELKPAKYLIPQPKPEEKTSLELMPSKYLIKKNPDSKITSPPKSVIESNEMSETSLANKASQPLISSCKPALNSSVPSVFKSALQSVITQSKKHEAHDPTFELRFMIVSEKENLLVHLQPKLTNGHRTRIRDQVHVVEDRNHEIVGLDLCLVVVDLDLYLVVVDLDHEIVDDVQDRTDEGGALGVHLFRNGGSKRRNKVEKKDSKGNKDPMFGKWAADDCPDKTKSKPKDPEQVLKGMEKFLAESKEKKLQMIKERNIQFQKPPGD